MNYNFIFTDVNDALPSLMTCLLSGGEEVGSRNGRTLELAHTGITLKQPWKRELILPERKANIAAQVAETMWVLSGRNDIEWLSHYLSRVSDYSDDGTTWRAGYGPRLRNFGDVFGDDSGKDQLKYVLSTLQASPSSRQAVASIWDPLLDTHPGKDIACNNWLNFSSRLGKLDLHVAVRSNDAMWGWSGINTFEWSSLLEIMAGMLGLQVGSLHFSVTSFHLYEVHWEKASRIRSTDESFDFRDSPRFDAQWCGSWERFDELAEEWFNLEEQIRTGQDVGTNVDEFPEPMMRSWLRVLQWWWTSDTAFLEPLRETRLREACRMSFQPKVAAAPEVPDDDPTERDFVAYVNKLHEDKHQAYGDSWKRRGEMLGIMANIARKVDRLGSNSSDETSADTAIDLMVYLGKYRWWLVDYQEAPDPLLRDLMDVDFKQPFSDHTEPVAKLLEEVRVNVAGSKPRPAAELEVQLTADFEGLEYAINNGRKSDVVGIVDTMLERAYLLASSLW